MLLQGGDISAYWKWGGELMRLSGKKSVPGSENSRHKSSEGGGLPDLFEEQPGGQGGWKRVSNGKINKIGGQKEHGDHTVWTSGPW